MKLFTYSLMFFALFATAFILYYSPSAITKRARAAGYAIPRERKLR